LCLTAAEESAELFVTVTLRCATSWLRPFGIVWLSTPIRDHEEMSVPKVTYVYDDGSEHTVEVAAATSLMRAALRNQVRGIVGECGGAATCGTCHVYLDHSTEQFEPPSGDEDEMLEWTAAPRAANSRLSCQLVPTDEGAHLVVRVPAEQV
jgi:ferredoxin, 2Fe-2S